MLSSEIFLYNKYWKCDCEFLWIGNILIENRMDKKKYLAESKAISLLGVITEMHWIKNIPAMFNGKFFEIMVKHNKTIDTN